VHLEQRCRDGSSAAARDDDGTVEQRWATDDRGSRYGRPVDPEPRRRDAVRRQREVVEQRPDGGPCGCLDEDVGGRGRPGRADDGEPDPGDGCGAGAGDADARDGLCRDGVGHGRRVWDRRPTTRPRRP